MAGRQCHAPAALPPGKTRYPLYRRPGGPPGTVWTGAGNLADIGIRSADCPARSESLYRLSYPGPVSPGLTIRNCTLWPQSVFPYFMWISEQTAIISLYSISQLVFITEAESVFCAVQTGSWNKRDCFSSLQGWCTIQQQSNVFVCL